MYTDTASPGPKRCASWRLTMVQNFQTLPEIGRAGLKVGTIQKSTKSVQKHGPANKREAGDPCWCHPKSWGPSAVLCIPQARELCHSAPGNSGGNSQEAPGNSETCFRQFGCSVHAQKCGYIGHSAGNSGGNSRAIHGNSGRFSAIRVFCACPKRRKFGNSLPTQFPF